MAILLYCVADLSTPAHSIAGVAGLPVLRCEDQELAIFYSDSTPDTWLRAPLRETAEQFHRVQRELFRSHPIVAFRFPSILDSLESLRQHIESRGQQYQRLLCRFASTAQMDIVTSYLGSQSPHSTGAEYLRQRQQRHRQIREFTTRLRSQVAPLTKAWRQDSTANGLRCFALVERKCVEEFNTLARRVSVPAELSVRVSGPWPVAAFLDLKP
jgi:Gas vesicle synthesis protein GvpL/GvpF